MEEALINPWSDDPEYIAWSEANPQIRAANGVAKVAYFAGTINQHTAELWAEIDRVLSEARESPEVYVDMTVWQAIPTDLIDFAERAAVAELATLLCLAENTIRNYGQLAATLRSRTPRVWGAFLAGAVSVPNARVTAEIAGSLPDDADFGVLDAELFEFATGLAPARYRSKARAVRERVHPVGLLVRKAAAAEMRRVFLEPDVDGMAWLSAHLPADQAAAAMGRIKFQADLLFTAEDETRTLEQIRADVAADLLTGGGFGTGAVGVTVGVTVPVLTLLGGDEPGTLEGYGPIDADTARRMAAHAPSFHRILTDPITGAILTIDRKTYRPPADLKRMVGILQPLCQFAGCGKPATESDIDHINDRATGGKTRLDNLMTACRGHHRMKHVTKWEIARGPTGTLQWTSPLGRPVPTNPPPF